MRLDNASTPILLLAITTHLPLRATRTPMCILRTRIWRSFIFSHAVQRCSVRLRLLQVRGTLPSARRMAQVCRDHDKLMLTFPAEGNWHSCGQLSSGTWSISNGNVSVSFSNGDNGRSSVINLVCDPSGPSQVVGSVDEQVRHMCSLLSALLLFLLYHTFTHSFVKGKVYAATFSSPWACANYTAPQTTPPPAFVLLCCLYTNSSQAYHTLCTSQSACPSVQSNTLSSQWEVPTCDSCFYNR